MSSSICQGLQSCVEPRLMEPRVLRLKLAPPKSNLSPSSARKPCLTDPKPNSLHQVNRDDDNKTQTHQNAEVGGWSFLQTLTNTIQTNTNDKEKEKVYVHPLVKRSSSMLSAKSLEMCTESLGSETGNEVSDISDDFSFLPLSETNGVCTKGESLSKSRQFLGKKRSMNRSRSFPPPLTSISGSSGVQVRPHREGGRLVLEAVSVSSCPSYFHAERSEGRLRLCLLRDSSDSFENEEGAESKYEECEEEEGIEEDGVEIEAEEDEEMEEEADSDWSEDLDENSGSVGGEIGNMGKFARPSRCMEGGSGSQGLLNWEQFWVAT